MGLDQYAYVNGDDDSRNEIAYWRKHPNLQGWMEQLWESKGRPLDHVHDPEDFKEDFNGSFNCIPIELTMEDLNQLEKDIIFGGLPGTTGFFFGGDSDDYYKQQDLEFVLKAKQEILCGNRVFYSSWW
jgi:hypothetical protein